MITESQNDNNLDLLGTVGGALFDGMGQVIQLSGNLSGVLVPEWRTILVGGELIYGFTVGGVAANESENAAITFSSTAVGTAASVVTFEYIASLVLGGAIASTGAAAAISVVAAAGVGYCIGEALKIAYQAEYDAVGSLTQEFLTNAPTIESQISTFTNAIQSDIQNAASGLVSTVSGLATTAENYGSEVATAIDQTVSGIAGNVESTLGNFLNSLGLPTSGVGPFDLSGVDSWISGAMTSVLAESPATDTIAQQDFDAYIAANAQDVPMDFAARLQTEAAGGTASSTTLENGLYFVPSTNGDFTLEWPGDLGEITISNTYGNTGTLLTQAADQADGTSQITTYNVDGSSVSNDYTGPNGTGSLTETDTESSNGTSQITTYNSAGSTTTTYSGPNGTGVITEVDISNTTANIVSNVSRLEYRYTGSNFNLFDQPLNYTGSNPFEGQSIRGDIFIDTPGEQLVSSTYYPAQTFSFTDGVTSYSGPPQTKAGYGNDPFAAVYLDSYYNVIDWQVVILDGDYPALPFTLLGSQPSTDGGSIVNTDGTQFDAETFTPGTWSAPTVVGSAVTIDPLAGQIQALTDVLSDPGLSAQGSLEDLAINGPGEVEVTGVATVPNLIVNDGGSLVLQGGSLDTDPITIAAGGNISGYGTITGAVTDNGTITASGGILGITGSVSGGGALAFASGGSLQLDSTTLPTTTISGFVPGDTLDLTSIAFDSTGSAPLGPGNVLQIVENGGTHTINLDPSQNFSGDIFQLSSDAAGGTVIGETTDSALVTQLYQDILGRDPDPGGLASWTTALKNGGSLQDVRDAFANSPEAQGDLTLIYNAELGRAPDPGGLAAFTGALAGGASLQDVRNAVAFSGEAQGDLTLIYNAELGRVPDPGGLAAFTGALAGGASLQDVRNAVAFSGEAQGDLTLIYNAELGRAPDPGGLAAFTGALAGGASLQDVRNAVAFSGEAQGDLSAIFQTVESRSPDMAELAGMENQLAPPGGALSSVQPGAGFTLLAVPSGNQSLTALATPEEFDFSSIAFGNDTIAGFDPTRDAIRLNHTQAANFASLNLSTVAGGTLIAFDATHSIALNGIAQASLAAANFRFV
jgi:hypothetical protein